MSEKPHTVAIGAFVLGALLIGVTIVIFTLGSGFGQAKETVVMVFDGSVKGLNVGAPIALRGVQIGQVTSMELMLQADSLELIMLVQADLSNRNIKRLGTRTGNITDELIARGLRAQLRSQSLLTGLLYIQLDFHPDKPAVLVAIDSDYTQIPTIPTDLELITRKIEEMDLAQVAQDLQDTIHGINVFVTSDAFQSAPANLRDTLASLTALSEQLRTQLASTGPKLDGVLAGAQDTLAGANTRLPRISGQVEENLELLNRAIAAFEQTMTNVDSLVAPGSGTNYQLNRALRELTLASRAIQRLANLLDEQPEALLRGKREETK